MTSFPILEEVELTASIAFCPVSYTQVHKKNPKITTETPTTDLAVPSFWTWRDHCIYGLFPPQILIPGLETLLCNSMGVRTSQPTPFDEVELSKISTT